MESDYNPPPEDTADRLVHDEMVATMRKIGLMLKNMMPPGVSFSLFLFQIGPGGWLTYMSSADRQDVVATLHEWIERMEEDMARGNGT